MSTHSTHAELSTLLALFYRRPEQLGHFEEIGTQEMPEPYRELLAHPHHMTVAMEQHHRSAVDVRVLATKITESHYARRILLARQSDGQVVQFGIMRLGFEYFSPQVRKEIESQSTPLGRILIQHNILWEIELISLWRIVPGPDMQKFFGIGPEQTTFGRTAVIRCNHEPAVELLEIARPE